MKKTLILSTLAASSIGLQAATIVWDNADPSNTENIVTDSSVMISSVIGAWNLDDNSGAHPDRVVGSVTFKNIYSGGATSVSSGGLTIEHELGDGFAVPWSGTETGDFAVVMGTQGAKDWRGATHAMTLSGLTENTSYRIQFLYSASNEGSGTSTTIDIDGSATDGVVQADPGHGGANDGLGQYIVGTMSTGASETEAVITYTGKAQVSAIIVSAVPEPSSAALLGLGGLALILRRRK